MFFFDKLKFLKDFMQNIGFKGFKGSPRGPEFTANCY